MVLAGGEGKRLWPLTADRAKPAVPFGGNYRLVDFALSNLVNGEFRRIAVLTQYKSHSLDRHLATTWNLSALLGNYVTPVPAQQRRGPRWLAALWAPHLRLAKRPAVPLRWLRAPSRTLFCSRRAHGPWWANCSNAAPKNQWR